MVINYDLPQTAVAYIHRIGVRDSSAICALCVCVLCFVLRSLLRYWFRE
jgi:hypothetical protein